MTDLQVPEAAVELPPRITETREGVRAPLRASDVGWWALIAAVAVTALIFALLGLVLRPGAGDATAKPKGPPQDVTVSMKEFAFTPSNVVVEPGRKINLTVHNAGTMAHDLKLNGLIGPGVIQPGQQVTVLLDPIEVTTQAWCTVAGHKASGMVMTFTVNSSATPATAAAAVDAAADTSKDATIDFNATPPADWKPFDPTLKPADGATEHKITMHAAETVLAVAPGVTQEMWTFDGQVPGPILRGHVGDLFTVTLVNDGKMGHSIDFHASKVAWNDEMRTINSGESLVYQYKADYAGIFMYHCGTAPALHHIGNGMYGAVIIDPPDLAPVDHEYVLVQSEIYTGPQGQPGDLTKMQNEAADAVVFNGYVSQYKFSPIRVEPNERVRVWVLDAGPSENSSFHIVGTIFDTVYKEGEYLLQPGAGHGGSQALDLQPAQGGFVEFSLAEQGLYPIVTHKFANVGKGALGLFQAGDVAAAPVAGH
jgi:nitrite reductase (NO-forming)